MTTYVLIPGACHGGWCYDLVTDALRERGHRVHPLTLTGLGDRAHLRTADVNLDTHIADVLATLTQEQVTDAVVVGHSYGGMLVSAVADRAPERVRSLVYLDAFVPRDGDSCWTLTDDDQRAWYLAGDGTGHGVAPLPFFDERATAHPLATLLQPIRLGPAPTHLRRTYLYAKRWPVSSPFAPTYERLRVDPQWTVHALDAAHNLMRDAPEELLAVLLDHGADT